MTGDFIAGFSGYCSAAKDGCETKFTIGFLEKDVKRFVQDPPDQGIHMWLHVKGCCLHEKGKPYGELRGEKRKAVTRLFIEQKKPPSEFAKDQSILMDSEAHHSNNRAHTVGRDVAYNLSREARTQECEDLGLDACKLSNILKIRYKIEEEDTDSRQKLQDDSVNCLGIIRKVALCPSVQFHLWTKNSLHLYHSLGKNNRLVINMDATGGLLDFPMVDKLKDKVLHTKLTINPKYALLNGKSTTDNTVGRMLSPITVAECVSNKNTVTDIVEFLSSMRDCENDLFGENINPLIVMTDCSPQLQSAALETLGRNGKFKTRIGYANCVLLCLFHYEHLVKKCNQKDNASLTGIATDTVAIMRQYVGVFLKSCKSHVYRAPCNWMKNNKNAEVSHIRMELGHMFSAFFSSVLRDEQLSVAIIRMSVLVALLEKEKLQLPSSYSLSTPLQDERTPKNFKKERELATEIEIFVNKESLSLLVKTQDNLSTSINSVGQKENWKGHDAIIEKAKKNLNFLSCYLRSISREESNGKLGVSVVYGSCMRNDKFAAMSQSGFWCPVVLPIESKTAIRNPVYSPTVAKYIRSTWLVRPALWSRAIVNVLENATEMSIEDNNQASEAVFKNVKHNQGAKRYASEPATYLYHRWQDCCKSEKVFIQQYDVLNKKVTALKSHRSKKQTTPLDVLTQDEQTQKDEEQEDEKWEAKGLYVCRNDNLRNELQAIFDDKEIGHSYKLCHLHVAGTLGKAENEKDKFMSYTLQPLRKIIKIYS